MGDAKELLAIRRHALLGMGIKLNGAGEHSRKQETTMLDVLRAATVVAAVIAGVWLYNSLQVGWTLQITTIADTR
jgi:hypothetical protein